MGKGTSTTGIEQASVVFTASVTAATTYNLGVMLGYYNLFFTGTFSAIAQLEKSFDGGNSFVPASLDTAGDPASYSVPASVTGFEPEKGIYYRVNCTAYTSGTINVRLSANVNFTGTAWGA